MSPNSSRDSLAASMPPVARRTLQRACIRGNRSAADGECAECRKQASGLQRERAGGSDASTVPKVVGEVLRSAGEPLSSGSRGFFESRFGRDFSQVRVHADARAAESADAVNALAYTVGRHIAFAAGRYRPETEGGRHLLVHELTHVVQQGGGADIADPSALTIGPPDGAAEREAQQAGASMAAGARVAASAGAVHPVRQQTLSRADRDATGYTMRLGTSTRTGVQFVPTDVRDTQVGPVTAQGGLASAGASRLSVIVAQNLSLRTLARLILPLWTTATPFTPPGAVAPLPLDIITDEELAQGLLVYNQTYLPVPAMTQWRAGLRFPLPVEIDELTGMATLHPLQIRALAGAFDPAWAPLLDVRTAATAAPAAAALAAEVTAFLAREPTALSRGAHLAAQALTNAVATVHVIQEAFRQLGASSFDVALAFMDFLVNRQVSLLAAQRDGASILAQVRGALAAAPAVLSASQQTSLDRANLMLGLVAGVAAAAPPGATRTRAEKTITVDTVKLDGSTHNPATQIAVANAIYSQCNVRVLHGVNATASNAQTVGWLGGNTDLRASPGCGTLTAEERAVFRDASASFGLGARFQAFFAATATGINASGYSCPNSLGPAALLRNRMVVLNSGDSATLSHELGHLLVDPGAHLAGTVMGGRPAAPAMRPPLFNNAQCTNIHNHA